MANLAGVDLELRQDPDRLRKADQRRAVGNADQLFQHTGWQPQIAFEQTLQDILTDWDKRDA
jgi:GDP-4-dehydro-6-deoxy-D-mannose reductase